MHCPERAHISQSGRARIIVLVVLVVLLAAAATGGYFFVVHRARGNADRFLADIRSQGYVVTYGDLKYSFLGGDAVITDMALNLPPGFRVTVDRVVVGEYRMQGDMYERVKLRFENLVFPLDQGPFTDIQEGIAAFGLDAVSGDLAIDFELDQDRRLLQVDEYSLRFNELFELRFSMTMGDVPFTAADMEEQDPDGAVFYGAELTYTDHSLIERLVNFAAYMDARDPEAVLAEQLAEIEELLARAREQDSEMAVALFETLLEFAADPGTLHITAAPPEPLSWNDFMAAEGEFDVIELLHVTAEAD